MANSLLITLFCARLAVFFNYFIPFCEIVPHQFNLVKGFLLILVISLYFVKKI